MINVLSLFDGMAGARVALDRLGIECNYYASEVDKYAIKIAKKNYPDIKHLGCIKDIKAKDLPPIDLILGGSPCQDLSVAKSNRKGLKGEKSSLFYEYVRLLRECNPKYFILENVASMGKESRNIITKLLGVSPIKISSALVTAQNRKRYYWTNFLVFPPIDRGILLKDIILDGQVDKDKAYCVTATYRLDGLKTYLNKKKRQIVFADKSYCLPATDYKENVKSLIKRNKKGLIVKETGIYTVPRGFNKGGLRITDKAPAVTSNAFEHNNKLVINPKYTEEGIRKLHPIECERLQGFSDNYTEGVSNTQRYKMIGNSFTVPVIEHILSFIKEELK